MQVITWDLAKGFSKKGIKVTCITTTIPDKPPQFIDDGIEIVALQNTKPGAYSQHWWNASKEYIKKNHKTNCDILLSVSISGITATELKSVMESTIFVIQAHGTSLTEIQSKIKTRNLKSLISIPKNIYWLAVDLKSYSNFDGIVAAGRRVFTGLNNPIYKHFLKSTPITYIPNGIDTSIFRPSSNDRNETRSKLGIADHEFVILVASRLHKQKGIEFALKAFSLHSRQHKSILLVVGTGPEESNLIKLTRRLGITNKVKYIGATSIDDLPKYINASDVYLFPTLHEEGLPLLPLESLACGIPVLASRHLKEISEASAHVHPIEPRDFRAIADKLDTLHHENNRIGPSHLPHEYSIDGVIDKYLDLFATLKSKKSAPPKK